MRGGGAKLLTKDTEFLNCVIGCLVKGGATAQLDDSKFICCGRDRTDAASLSVSGKGSIATCRGCEFDTSDHHGVKADSQAAIILINSKVINVRQHGVLVLGRLSKPLTVDNFEGIAVVDRPDGERRLFIIADDNFSDRQQTLLFAFRLRPRGS